MAEIENPTPPTDEAKKLVGSNYADRAAAALPDSRAFGHDILKLLGDYDPDHVTVQDCRRMMDDYTIKMSMHYSMAPMVTASYDFQCDDPRIRAAVKENYDQIHVPLMLTALNSWVYGYQGCVKDFEYGKLEATYEDPDTGEVKPVWPEGADTDPVLMKAPIPLPPEQTEVELKRGKFAGIRTALARLGETSGEDTKDADLVPPEHSLWFAHQFEQTFRNWYGRSRLVPVYKPWYSFWANWYNRDRHADADADPALQVWYPPGDSRVTDPDAPGGFRLVPNREVAQSVGRELRNGATIVWPSDVHVAEDGKITTAKKWEAAFLTGGDNLAVFNDLLDRLEVAKYRACLVPEQTLIEAIKGTGARNVTGEQSDTFGDSLKLDMVYFDRVINDYLIQAFVEANFGSDAATCRKVTTGFDNEDASLATELIKIAFSADPNALPIKFEALLEQAKIAMYSKKEQEERDQAIQEAQQAQADAAAAAQPVGPLPGEDPNAQPAPGDAGAPTGGPQLSAEGTESPLKMQLMLAAADALRSGDREGASALAAALMLAEDEGRDVNLSLPAAPPWAHKEGRRREKNVEALADRLRDVVRARYQDVFEACAESVADLDLDADDGDADALHLARRGGLLGKEGVVDRMRQRVGEKVAGYRAALEDELASLYHAVGAAELARLGLSGESWDVGRAEVQEWASERAGDLIVTMDRTVVEQHVRPWLEKALADPAYKADPLVERPQGIAVSALELAAQLTDAFSAYPDWMAERVVRTEARMGYNQSAADMWERVGVQDVKLFDGLGGRTGRTDAECLARNGQVVNLDTFRRLDQEEHPNGTLGAVAMVETMDLRPLMPQYVFADARQSPSLYAVTDDGDILSESEVGALYT